MSIEQVSRYPSLDILVAEIAGLRPLPATAVRILEITEGDHFSAHELATVIASDQALTAKLLRLANSAYYGYARRINTVRDAVVLLGFRAVRSATLVSSVIDSVEGNGNLNREEFWRFSVTVGMLSEMLARAEGHHQHHAFTAGVLHHIGRLALDQHAPEALADAVALAKHQRIPVIEAEHALLGFTDVQLSAALAEHWNFPEKLVEAIAHWPEPSAPRGSLAPIVGKARAFARSYGLPDGLESAAAQQPSDEWLTPAIAASLKQLGGLAGVCERAEVFVESTLRA